MVKNIKAISPIVICLLIGTIVFGQSEGSKSGPPAPNMDRTPPELSLPIDSGLIFLFLAGLGYGAYITISNIKAKSSSR